MNAGWRLLPVLVLGLPALARAALPCTGWESGASTLELHGAGGHIVLRAAPEALAALRQSLLAHCEAPDGPRPALDIGPVEVDADLRTRPESGTGVLELQLRMRAERLFLKVQ